MVEEYLKVIFGTPEHGWLPIEIQTSKATIQEEVSDAISDTLGQLSIALLRLAKGARHEHIEWFLEPDFWHWDFQTKENQLKWTFSGPSQIPISLNIETVEALQHLWSSLLELQSNPVWGHPDAGTKVWSWPFPQSELSQLGHTIQFF